MVRSLHQQQLESLPAFGCLRFIAYYLWGRLEEQKSQKTNGKFKLIYCIFASLKG